MFDETETVDSAATPKPADTEAPAQDQALVRTIHQRIKEDIKHHEKAFKQMRRDMHVAKYGRLPGASTENYTANIAGRHVKQKTAGLYAKNPKATARRRETLDYELWDENPQTLQLAYQSVMNFEALRAQAQAAAEAAPMIDPKTGLPVQPDIPVTADIEQAQALLADFQRGTAQRTIIQKTGRTLEILFAQALREQKPLDFKMGMKKLVRRACTTAVGYVELGFQRETGPRPGLAEQLADHRARIDHIKNLAQGIAEGEHVEGDSELAELEHAVAALQAEPEVVVREGLIVDFPMSTKVIPDKLCKSLVGFVGARHITLEYLFSHDEVKELFGVDLPKNATDDSSDKNGNMAGDEDDGTSPQIDMDFDDDSSSRRKGNGGMVKVFKHYDKPSGLVYFLAEGYQKFLRTPAAPDVFVEDFWPVYALTFNDVEHEDELYPPSDVALLLDMQLDYNRSRQGKREHRKAARPRWAFSMAAGLTDEDIQKLKTCEPFEAVGLTMDPQTKLAEMLQPIPVPGVDPNLYDTGEIFQDTQLVVGTQEAQFGGVSKATATESAIAANSSASSDGSSVDDLDAFLSVIARASGQILLREVSQETALKVVGPGAVWPHLTLTEIAEELYLEIEAGSTGKPNQAVQVNNAKTIIPFLLQTGEITPMWIAKYLIRILDDKIDVTDALIAGIPSIVARNQNKQIAAADPAADPTAQGPQGATNGPAPPGGEGGSDAAFGSNQV